MSREIFETLPSLFPGERAVRRIAGDKAKNDYDGFVEKFKPKKTTDDCYTPSAVYQAVLDWLSANVDGFAGREVVRPFWPGGDYMNFNYPPGCVVVDNPPFSIYARIVRFFISEGIDFFLFAPSLTQPVMDADVTYIVTMIDVTYENGAVVRTSFTTNLFLGLTLWACPALYDAVRKAQPKIGKSKSKTIYPAEVVTAALLGKVVCRGVELKIPASDCVMVRTLDNMKKDSKALFGNGFLLSKRAAAERAAAEFDKAYKIRLSEREQQIVEGLGG